MASMFENTHPPAWQTSLNPALVERLHRDAGIIPRAIARRILGWAAYFSRRTGAFSELLRQRGHVGSLRTSDVPIVHAVWVDEREKVWPVQAPSSTVVVVQARPSIEGAERKAPPGNAPTSAPRIKAPRAVINAGAVEIKASPGGLTVAPAGIKAALADVKADPRTPTGAPAAIIVAPRAVEGTLVGIDNPPPAPRIDRAEIKAPPSAPTLARTSEIARAPSVEPRPVAPLVEAAAPVAPRAQGPATTPDLPPARPGHRTIAGRTDAPGAVVIQLPPRRRVVRGALRSIDVPSDTVAPSPTGPVAPAKPTVEVAAPGAPTILPSVASGLAPPSAPARIDAGSTQPPPHRGPLVLVTHRPRSSSIVARSEPSLPLVHATRRDAAAPPRAVEARRLGPSPIGEASAPRVAVRGAPPAARSPIVHAGQGAAGDAPRRHEPPSHAAPRPVLFTSSPIDVLQAPSTPVPAPADASAAKAPQRELDLDTVVEKVERRILKNLAIERERKGGVR
jgi:hypothetical protein